MSYCSGLTNAQLENVLCDEAERIGNHRTGPVVDAAWELYHEAREELAKRGKDADMILRERGVRKPRR